MVLVRVTDQHITEVKHGHIDRAGGITQGLASIQQNGLFSRCHLDTGSSNFPGASVNHNFHSAFTLFIGYGDFLYSGLKFFYNF